MRFQFRLRSVLELRQRERDRKQQSVADARARLAKQITERDRLHDLRSAVIEDLRVMKSGGPWHVDQTILLQHHADHLGAEFALAEAAIIKGQADLETSLTLLVAANRSVRALEKLAERQFAEHQASLAKSAARG